MALGRELPDDVAADVLRRLPPRSLACCRCACRAWRDLADDRRLLRADLLPRTVGGVFITYSDCDFSLFLARPTPTAGPPGPRPSVEISAGDMTEFTIPGPGPGLAEVLDHCNGLLLCTTIHDQDYVANPATRQWARLPPPPPPPPEQIEMMEWGFRQNMCLVYDPTVSPHYHVFIWIGSSSNSTSSSLHLEDEHSSKSALRAVHVYSSETGRWAERWFAPEVPVLPPVVEVESITIAVYDDGMQQLSKAYWRGRLYLLCKNGVVLRISISNANYRLIPSPGALQTDVQFRYQHHYYSLGRSEKGIYCASVYCWLHLRIFLLNESACGQVVWELKHSVDLTTVARENYSDRPDGPWTILEDVKYHPYGNERRREVAVEWNSDDDNVLNTEDMVEEPFPGYITLLGFHPYKEVVFFNAALSRAVAYHWNTSKFQDLGNICPTGYLDFARPHRAGIDVSFIYTPCWMDNLPKSSSSLEAPIEDQLAQCVQAAEGRSSN